MRYGHQPHQATSSHQLCCFCPSRTLLSAEVFSAPRDRNLSQYTESRALNTLPSSHMTWPPRACMSAILCKTNNLQVQPSSNPPSVSLPLPFVRSPVVPSAEGYNIHHLYHPPYTPIRSAKSNQIGGSFNVS